MSKVTRDGQGLEGNEIRNKGVKIYLFKYIGQYNNLLVQQIIAHG
jgi:hypothetical protein